MKHSIMHKDAKAMNIERLQHRSPDISTWKYSNNNELTELLEHLADELAREYVQLMGKSGVEETHK